MSCDFEVSAYARMSLPPGLHLGSQRACIVRFLSALRTTRRQVIKCPDFMCVFTFTNVFSRRIFVREGSSVLTWPSQHASSSGVKK